MPRISFIGFGEAAQAFCQGWGAKAAPAIRAFDIKTDAEKTARQKRADYRDSGVSGCETLAEALANTEVVFSMVTADQALAAAESAAKNFPEGALYFDCNSVAPDTKRHAAVLIEAAGGRYVDVAVMAPVHPKLHKTPLLVSGPHTRAALGMMARLDMETSAVAGEIGAASSVKMVRSIMVKGLEALMAECLLVGRRAGVEELVLDTLDKSYPGFGFRPRTGYALGRMQEHGLRRAAEMHEVVKTVEQLGLDPAMSRATVDWQQAIGSLGLAEPQESYPLAADALLAALATPRAK